MDVVEHTTGLRLFKPICALTFAWHASAALAAKLAIPNAIGMVLANPPQAEADRAFRIYHPVKVL